MRRAAGAHRARTARRIGYVLVACLVQVACLPTNAPSISRLDPMGGPPGTIVEISGANLQGVSAVTFGGAIAQVVSTTASTVVTRVPAAGRSGLVAVTGTLGTAKSTVIFVVTAGPEPVDAGPVDPPAVASSMGYSFLNVATARGTFGTHLIKERLSEVSVKTITAGSSECFDKCPVKPLAQYVSESSAYAGMNGTYLCPPDYADCTGKVNSFDYAVYNSSLRKWINPRALNGQNGLATFDGGSATFYRRGYLYAQSVAARAPITAGLSMQPLLLQNGAVVNSESEQSAAQQQRSARGAIGVDGTNVYLALVLNASVTDTAHVLQALGVRQALNLDGGGTSAMHFDGSYKVGPGRLLPNAVLLTKP